ncbi:barstar family protein [Acholeplasma palmae]|uniref:barstar family protein n=1 Tax=Acholeplasma palmae TaxID=38986 RepID=UPI0005FA1F1B|nr:barstar family protein [Alteracholeplasma palmae]
MSKVEYLDKKETNDIKVKYVKKFYEINGDDIKTIKDFFDCVYDLFGFLKYNVYSYDAFLDWMRDDYFKWDPIIIIVNQSKNFLENFMTEKKVMLDIFNEDIIPFWEKKGIGFRLIFEV